VDERRNACGAPREFLYQEDAFCLEKVRDTEADSSTLGTNPYVEVTMH